MSEPKDFIEYILVEDPKFSDSEVQRDAMIAYARECETENARLRERIRLLEEEPCPDCNGYGYWGKAPDGRYRSCAACGGHEDRLGSGKLRAPMLEENVRLEQMNRTFRETLADLCHNYTRATSDRASEVLDSTPDHFPESAYNEMAAENAELRTRVDVLAEALASELHVFASAEFQDGDGPVFIRCFFCGTDRPGEHDPDKSCGRMEAALRVLQEAR